MAAAGSIMEEFEQLAECPVCQELMTNARQLPCLHSFCTPCIEHLVSASQVEILQYIVCPMCRTKCECKSDGATSFPLCYFINSFGESLQKFAIVKKSSANCTVCERKQDQAESTWICLDCTETLCDHCNFYHRTFTSGHKTLNMSEIKKTDIENFLEERTQWCKTHGNKCLEYFCQDCKDLLCVSCCITAHRQHMVHEIGEVSETHKKRIEKVYSGISSNLENSISATEQQKAKKTTMNKAQEDERKMINTYSLTATAEINMKESQLLKALKKKKEIFAYDIQNKADHLAKVQERFKRARDHYKMLVELGNPTDICQTFVGERHELFDLTARNKEKLYEIPQVDLKLESYEQVLQLPNILIHEESEFEIPFDPSGVTATDDGRVAVCEYDGTHLLVRNPDGSQRNFLVGSSSRIRDVRYCHSTQLFQLSDGRGFLKAVQNKSDKMYLIQVPSHRLHVTDNFCIATYAGKCYICSFISSKGICEILSFPSLTLSKFTSYQWLSKLVIEIASSPSQIDVNATRIVLSYFETHEVRVYSRDGAEIFTHGTGYPGSKYDQLDCPWGVSLDPGDRVIVADGGNNRFVMLASTGDVLTLIGANYGIHGPARCVTFTDDGHILAGWGNRAGPWKVKTFKYVILK